MHRLQCCCLIAGLSFAAAARGQDMPLSDILLNGQGWELVGEGYKFTEGPAADAEGDVFFTDVPNSRIYKVDAAGKVSLFVENSFETNGLAFGPDGRLYGCQNGKQRIVVFDSSGAATMIAEGVKSNDIVVRRDGGIYFTDPENHQVWYINGSSCLLS